MTDSWLMLDCGGEQAAGAASDALASHGWRVVRSFSVSGADAGGCKCNASATESCQCRYCVLLVFAGSGPPAVVTVHGQRDRSRVDVVLDPNAPVEPALFRAIHDALTQIAIP